MAKVTKKGRSRGSGRFVMLTFDLIGSPAWEGLSTQARAVLIQVAKRYNGSNNGRLAVSVRMLEAECCITKTTAAKAIKKLVEAGFLDVMQQGAFSNKKSMSAEYRLTWFKCDRTGEAASRAWKSRPASETALAIKKPP
jgi:hypothetical protein